MEKVKLPQVHNVHYYWTKCKSKRKKNIHESSSDFAPLDYFPNTTKIAGGSETPLQQLRRRMYILRDWVKKLQRLQIM